MNAVGSAKVLRLQEAYQANSNDPQKKPRSANLLRNFFT